MARVASPPAQSVVDGTKEKNAMAKNSRCFNWWPWRSD